MTTTRKIVETLRNEGAQTVAELATKLSLTNDRTGTAVRQMASLGSVCIDIRDGKRYYYVTPRCAIPQGFTHQEILELWK